MVTNVLTQAQSRFYHTISWSNAFEQLINFFLHNIKLKIPRFVSNNLNFLELFRLGIRIWYNYISQNAIDLERPKMCGNHFWKIYIGIYSIDTIIIIIISVIRNVPPSKRFKDKRKHLKLFYTGGVLNFRRLEKIFLPQVKFGRYHFSLEGTIP